MSKGIDKNTDTNTNGSPDSGKQIVQALDTIAHAVLGDELQLLRGSITERDASLVERVDAVRKELGEAVSNLKNELHRATAESRLKISESEEKQQKSLLELGDRTDKWIEGVKKELQEATQASEERIKTAKSSMSDNLATQAKKLDDRIETVSRTLATLQQEIRQQEENSQRFAGLLNNLGAVFQATPGNTPSTTTPPATVPEAKRDVAPAKAEPAVATEKKDATAKAAPAKAAAGKGPENQADLDKALDEAFSRK